MSVGKGIAMNLNWNSMPTKKIISNRLRWFNSGCNGISD